ncbi:putative F-box protein At3g10240 [Silene latifolia]|uniref:putative F-box protein At3g10240 n=1 Tax=Silene latifolia TaxID=37657 RepID=UPI003D78B0D6
MTTHLNNYTQNDTNSLLLYREISREVQDHEKYLLYFEAGFIPNRVYHTSIFPFKANFPSKPCSYFVGSIHGLVCLSDTPYLVPESRIILWNPLLQKFIKLPKSITATNDLVGLTSVLGFAYNSKRNDHRVVKISYKRGDNELSPLIEVYSVWEHTWRTITRDYLVDNSIHSVSFSHCFINGVIHWLVRSEDEKISCFINDRIVRFVKWILLFDVVEETFQTIELPEAIVELRLGNFGVCEYKSKLSLSWYVNRVIFDNSFSDVIYRVWVKDDESWCMILNIELHNYTHIGPIEYLGRKLRNGEIFGFIRKSDGMLMMYDFMDRQFIELGFCQDDSTKFAAFTDSLVLLDQNTDAYTDDELERYFQII